jgi:hypothetical protein
MNTALNDTSFHTPRLKLRCWPPDELIRNDTKRIRMATLLLSQALSSEELAHMCQETLHRCNTFLSVLNSFDLLIHPTAIKHTDTNATSLIHTKKRSLVQSIRKTLGLVS